MWLKLAGPYLYYGVLVFLTGISIKACQITAANRGNLFPTFTRACLNVSLGRGRVRLDRTKTLGHSCLNVAFTEHSIVKTLHSNIPNSNSELNMIIPMSPSIPQTTVPVGTQARAHRFYIASETHRVPFCLIFHLIQYRGKA